MHALAPLHQGAKRVFVLIWGCDSGFRFSRRHFIYNQQNIYKNQFLSPFTRKIKYKKEKKRRENGKGTRRTKG